MLLLKPETFMNLSGRAVRQAIDFYKLPIEEVLIVCDDFNLPLGKLRVRAKGSHGGQNGLRDIQQSLGTDGFARLRVGVGQPGRARRSTSCSPGSSRANGRRSKTRSHGPRTAPWSGSGTGLKRV